MKGQHHPRNDASLNAAGNPSIRDLIDRVDLSRRRFIQGSASSVALAAAGGLTLSGLVGTVHASGHGGTLLPIGFNGIDAARVPLPDLVRVPEGYTVQLLQAWGEPIMPGGAAWLADASQDAAAQARQVGMHSDGMHYFGFIGRDGKESSERGLLCVNHEYTHEEVLHADGLVGPSGYSIAKCRKSQAAHGVSVHEIRRRDGRWTLVRNSPFGRRFTGNTRMRVAGPAAGHPLLKSKRFDITPGGSVDTGTVNDGFTAWGTLNNCAHGVTPWGTYLTCEENWNGYFAAPTLGAAIDPNLFDQKALIVANGNRYGISTTGFGYRWHEVDPRFNADTNPLEPHLFGWVVEIDPFNPSGVPVKRTALGRFKHESAQYVLDEAGDLAFYMGDDERNEYIYKFVCSGKYDPSNRAANRELLDSGTLYVARFNADGTGTWLALEPDTVGVNGQALRDNPRFAGIDDADVKAKILIQTRQAADAVGATMMDRPEWTGVRPRIGGFAEIEVYCTLTNNNRRGTGTASVNNPDGSTAAGSARPPVDAANPYANNIYGHIVRWRENGRRVRATAFTWDIFVQCGDTATTRPPLPSNDFKGNIVDTPNGSADYGAPDGLWFDNYGRLWVQTDQAGDGLGDWANIGANCMVAADPVTGATRRFLTGPPDCEVTGVHMTPDGRTMFVGIQHPGEGAPASNPTASSNWPASQWTTLSDGVTPVVGGRPRSGVVVITKNDGGIVGT